MEPNTLALSLPRLNGLPATLPAEGCVSIELDEGAPIFKASDSVQARVEALLHKQKTSKLGKEEEHEPDLYEEMDDYLSLLNRAVRNLLQHQSR